MNRLDPILDATRAEVARRRAAEGAEGLRARIAARGAAGGEGFLAALRRPGLSVIAEHKRRSPSAGPIREDLELEAVVTAYERGGAAAVSILTEAPHFGGSLADLERAAAVSGLPRLRKDFVVDAYQVDEALAYGADAVLLIVAALPPAALAALHARAREGGLAVLVEVHDRAELEVAIAVGAELIGVNNRDLTTLEVDVRRTYALLEALPGGTTVVAESGFSQRSELDELAAAGVDAVLIGEALMRAVDVEAACRRLTGA
jgi:indole-3-glycerol phosphate synthase